MCFSECFGLGLIAFCLIAFLLVCVFLVISFYSFILKNGSVWACVFITLQHAETLWICENATKNKSRRFPVVQGIVYRKPPW